MDKAWVTVADASELAEEGAVEVVVDERPLAK